MKPMIKAAAPVDRIIDGSGQGMGSGGEVKGRGVNSKVSEGSEIIGGVSERGNE